MSSADSCAFILRLVLGAVMLAHGWNHLFGSGGVEGTARWFGSMGLRPPRLHAWASGLTELGAGLCLLLGVLTSLQCAAVVGVMTVALVTAHRTNGFFVFRPGQGWEYVAVLGATSVALAILGPGSASVDDRIELAAKLDGGVGAALAGGLGVGAAGVLLAACWRPSREA
nr:DoxX family protein [Sporichthya polymorpha]